MNPLIGLHWKKFFDEAGIVIDPDLYPKICDPKTTVPDIADALQPDQCKALKDHLWRIRVSEPFKAELQALARKHQVASTWIVFWAPIVRRLEDWDDLNPADLNQAFPWTLTPQGRDYWLKLNGGSLNQPESKQERFSHTLEEQVELWWQAEKRQAKQQQHTMVAMRREVRAMITGNTQFHKD